MPPAANSRLTKEKHDVLIEAIRAGLYRDQAAALARISRPTLNRWISEGRKEAEADVPYAKARYREFYEEVMQVEAEFEAEMIANIRASAAKRNSQSWLAAITILERKYPQRYGRRDALSIDTGDKPLVEINVVGDPAVRELATGLLEALAAHQRRELTTGEEPLGEVIAED
jgi:transposase